MHRMIANWQLLCLVGLQELVGPFHVLLSRILNKIYLESMRHTHLVYSKLMQDGVFKVQWWNLDIRIR